MRKRWMQTGFAVGLMLGGGIAIVGEQPARAGETQYEHSDAEFLEQALAVNELELQLGRLASERGASAEVKQMGQKMVQKHGELGRQLAGLARQAGGSDKPVLSPEMRATVARVTAQSGEAFDATFKQVVDDRHRKELAMYRDEIGHATNPKLRELAQQRVAKLQEALAQAQKPAATAKKSDW